MKLSRANSWARVLEGDRAECRWLHEYVSCRDVRFVGGGPPDTEIFSMFDPVSGIFAAGLVPLIVKGAAADGVKVEVVDERGPAPCQLNLTADLSWLRDYQLATVTAAAQAGRGLIKAPTGSGKTEVGIALTRVIDCEWLFLVHRTGLVEQFARRYSQRTGERVGRVANGVWTPGTCNITVASFQTLTNALKDRTSCGGELIRAIGGLIIDESHAQPADTFYEVTQSFRGAYYRFGLSSTPLNRMEKDSLRTIGAIGPVVHRIPTQLLIERGVLSRASITMVPCVQEGDGGDYREVYAKLVSGSASRNELVVDLASLARKPALVFVQHIKHGKALAKLLSKAGLKVQFVNGSDEVEQREREVKRLVAGDTEVLVTTSVFQEGIDIPELASVVNASGGASEVAALQRLGRGMRACADKGNEFEAWDVLDLGQTWLEKHSKARRRAYESEGHVVRLESLAKLKETS